MTIDKQPPKPNLPCWNCHSTEWWWRESKYGKGEWLCKTCHPSLEEVHK